MTLQVAIIGAGIAGLSAASRLHEKGHEISLYEASNQIGGHARTISVPLESKEIPAELGVFMHDPISIHPEMNHYARKHGIEVKPFSLTISVEHPLSGEVSWSNHFPGPKWLRFGLTFCNAARRGFKNGYSLLEVMKFLKNIEKTIKKYGDISVGEFIEKSHCSKVVVEAWLLPHMLCWWGIPKSLALECSLLAILDSMGKVARFDQYIFPKGWNGFIDSIAAPLKGKIELNTPVDQVFRTPSGVQLVSKKGKRLYDAVLFATPPSAIATILQEASCQEIAILNGFPKLITRVYLHRDSKWIPSKQRCAIINLISDHRGPFCTFWCGGLHSKQADLFVSWGEELKIIPEESKTLATVDFERTIPSLSYMKSCREIHKIQGEGGIWYCGAHVHALGKEEVPSLWHENALRSGWLAADKINGLKS